MVNLSEYGQLVDRLLVEARGVAFQKILDRNELALSDFSELKKEIENDIGRSAADLKKRLMPGKEVEVVFSISDFFLVEPTYK